MQWLLCSILSKSQPINGHRFKARCQPQTVCWNPFERTGLQPIFAVDQKSSFKFEPACREADIDSSPNSTLQARLYCLVQASKLYSNPFSRFHLATNFPLWRLHAHLRPHFLNPKLAFPSFRFAGDQKCLVGRVALGRIMPVISDVHRRKRFESRINSTGKHFHRTLKTIWHR